MIFRIITLSFVLLIVGCSDGTEVKHVQPDNQTGNTSEPTQPVDDTTEQPTSNPPITTDDTAALNSFAVESRINGGFNGFGFDTVFELQNGQFWQQTSFNISSNIALSPKTFVVSDGLAYYIFIEGVTGKTKVKPISDISNVALNTDVFITNVGNDFKGFESGATFDLINHGLWQQTSPTYRYHYEYRPEVVVFGTRNNYKMIVPSMGEYVIVEPL